MIKEFVEFLLSHKEELLEQTVEHLVLTLVSLFFATILGLSIGIFISKKKRYASPVISFVNAIQTIPSIALLGFLLPFLGIGVIPAIVALFLYALLPIVRNTYTGIYEIEPSVKEAAIGMGMSPKQLLLKVELPFASPVIFAGIRTAFVINVGVATLCALIAAGGLGEFIFRGLSTNNPYMIMAGALPAACLALLFDWIMGLIEKRINQWLKPTIIVASILLISVIVYFTYPADNDKLKAGFPSEFVERGDGYLGLQQAYDLDLAINEMEIGLMYDAVNNGNVDVISGFSTDGRIKAYNLISLEDDKNYFPPYHAAPLVRQETLAKYPGLEEALNGLKGKISNEEMTAMNFEVDQNRRSFESVANDFLSQKGYKTNIQRNGGDIIIGSKNFTESFLLAHIFKLVIENQTPYSVELKLGFGGTKLLFDALNTDQIDLYPEYTGTGLLVILKEPKKDLLYQKDSVYNYVQTQFNEKYNLTWLEPLGFNNTFALMMRSDQANSMGVQSISDLSEK
ncbi:ABC transporter permease subunit [Fulvivirga sp. RKSG066]|uniref:ABC transporter permease/substrate-binding protein n=1 Tax=Fulvivirga aurantia TaxID=2529383 RepID=UPI0012BC252A|nr:ABC transporter permease/substrate-binding protein [Fulvivirga aurantia]MTI21346.1 ABC transporter permease subunit [Fulvivirga aurantia]